MARSTPVFLQSARITALAACEGVTLQLHSGLHTCYLLLLPVKERVSSNTAFCKAAAPCSSTLPSHNPAPCFLPRAPKAHTGCACTSQHCILCAVPSPSLLTCTGEVEGTASPRLSQRGEEEKYIYFFKTQTKPGIYCVLPKQYFKRKVLSHKKPGLRMAEQHRLQKNNNFSQIAK